MLLCRISGARVVGQGDAPAILALRAKVCRQSRLIRSLDSEWQWPFMRQFFSRFWTKRVCWCEIRSGEAVEEIRLCGAKKGDAVGVARGFGTFWITLREALRVGLAFFNLGRGRGWVLAGFWWMRGALASE